MRALRFLFAVLIIAAFSLAPAQNYRINSFDSAIDLHTDGSMDVLETIEVQFTVPQHGIYRFIPIHYETGKGIGRSIRISNVRATDEDGNPLEMKLTKEGANLKIRIGSKDHLEITAFPKVYKIGYKVQRQLNWFDDSSNWKPSAELYWNVTGNEWESGMDKVSATVSFPSDNSSETTRARMFKGVYGDRSFLEAPSLGSYRSNDLGLTAKLTRGTLVIETSKPLLSGEGLTVVLSVPATLIPKPTHAQSLLNFLSDNLGFLIPIPTALVMLILFWIFGMDPSGGPRVVQFDPPDGLTASQCGTLLDEKVDPRDLAAGIITLAVRGYLTIEPKEEGTVIVPQTALLRLTGKEAGNDLGPFETKLLTLLESCAGDIDDALLRSKVAPSAFSLKNDLYKSLVTAGYYKTSPFGIRSVYAVFGALAMFAAGSYVVSLDTFNNLVPAIVGGLIGWIVILIFAKGMPRRTQAGAQVRQKVAGLEEFIDRAKSDELKWQTEKMPDQALFETLLPYAVAFGLAVEWAKAFEKIGLATPSWYHSPYNTPFYPIYFANDLNSVGTRVATAATTPPRSSGSSGGNSGFSSGGFSGGGFGGGGGGSW